MKPLRVLVVEDSEKDAALVLRQLRKGGFEPVHERVETDDEMRDALARGHWDLVVADFTMPGFGALPALAVLDQSGRDIPVIVISGTIGEEIALETMRAGAHDYVMKDKLGRLVPAVKRELQEAQVRRERRRAARRLAAQQAVTRLAAELDNLEAVPARFLEVIGESLDWIAGSVWRTDRDAGVLRCVGFWQAASAEVRPFEEETRARDLVPGMDLPGQAWQRRKPVWTDDAAADPEFLRAEAAARSGLHRGIAFPVIVEREVVAILELLEFEAGAPDPELLQTVSAIGTQIGQLIARLQAIRALAASEARKSAMMNAALDCIIWMDIDGKVVDWNPAAEMVFGYSRDEAVGQELAGLVIPERFRDQHRRGLARYRTTGEGPLLDRRLEMPALRKDGSEFAVELTVVRVPTGEPPVFTAFLRDITERKRAEETVRETQRYLEEAQAIAHVGSWVSGLRNADPIWWSDECYRIFALPVGSPVSVARFFSLVHPDDLQAVRRAVESALRGGGPYDIVHRIVRPDQSVRVVHERAVVVRDEHGTPLRMVGTVQDITERVRIEERDRFLSRVGAELGATLDYPDVLRAIAELGVVGLADCCVVQVQGEPGQRAAVAHRVPERTRLAQRVANEQPAESSPRGIVRHVIASGRPVLLPDSEPPPEPARSVPEPVYDSDLPPVARALGASSLICVPLRARGRVFGAVTFILEAPEKAYGAFDLAVAEDFGRRAAFAIDNSRLYDEAREHARVRDEFIDILAHELKTPITPIRMQARSLQRTIDKDGLDPALSESLRPRLQGIEHAALRLEQLVETLLDISELTVGKFVLSPVKTDLVALVARVIERMQGEIRISGSSLSLDGRRPVTGLWDPARLEQLVVHLLSNALKYGGGNPIEVAVTGDRTFGKLSIRDHGVGIPAEEQVRVFERFERRAPMRHFGGLGLGLWIARRIADAHGGRIELWSRPGEGSRFTVELPRRPPSELARRVDERASREEGSRV